MIEITYEFWFDAAHRFPHMPVGHKYHGLHGHSFRAQIAVAGSPDATSGFIVDFAHLEAAGERVRERLDHRFLNEIEGLESPSLEHLARFVWRELEAGLPGLSRVAIHRDSHRHGCVYTGEPVAVDGPTAAVAARIAHA